jgi:hypothetical protein
MFSARIGKAVAILAVAGLGVFAVTQSGASSGTTTDKVKRLTANKTLSTTAGVETTILTVTLPAGDWIVHADDSAAGLNQPNDVVRCWLVAPGVHVGHATHVGNNDGYPIVGTISGTVGLHLTGSTLVKNTCSHDNTTGGTYQIDADATMWAHSAGSLSP